jgi:hypothetical protein
VSASCSASLAVAFDDDDRVVVIEADVDRVAVGLGDLDLPGRAVLGVAFDGVRLPALSRLERGGGRRIGLLPVTDTSPSSLLARAGPPATTAAMNSEGASDDQIRFSCDLLDDVLDPRPRIGATLKD